MSLNFRDLALDDKKVFDEVLAHMREAYGSEYCFPLVFVENVLGATQICDTDDMVFIKTRWAGRLIFFPPMLKDDAKFPQAIHLIEQATSQESAPLEIRMVSETQAKLFSNIKYQITDTPNLADYVYCAKDLIHLVGTKFHSKRNFITRFCNTYKNYIFREYDETKDRDNIMQLLKKWDANTLHEKWAVEDKLITRALDFHKELDLKIAVLYVGPTLVAFSINYVKDSEIGYTFFEKADTDYVGTYQVINQRTAELFFQNTKYVNRQCDMGVEGLRKAKLSYKPVKLLNKYKIQHKQLT